MYFKYSTVSVYMKEQNDFYAKFLINLQFYTLSKSHVIDYILQKLPLRTNQSINKLRKGHEIVKILQKLALNTNQSIDKLRKGHDIAKILLKLALNTIQPNNQSIH